MGGSVDLTLSFAPATACDTPGLLYGARKDLASLAADGATKYFATFDRLTACFQQAAQLTLDQLAPGPQTSFTSQGRTWTRQVFSHVLDGAQLDVSVAAQNEVPPDPQSLSTFALLSVSLTADDHTYVLAVEVKGYATELAKAAGTTAIGIALFKVARSSGRALWNVLRNVWSQSGTDDAVLGDSGALLGASESAVDEEMAGDVLAESMVEMEALTEIAGVMSTAGPIAIPVAILLGALFLIGLLVRKKVVVITHEIHLINDAEHQSFFMDIPALSNSTMIQYPSLTSDPTVPLAKNYQPVLPFPSALDLGIADFTASTDTAATAIFKFVNADHSSPPTHSFFLCEPSEDYSQEYGYQLCFSPNSAGSIRTFARTLPSIQKAMKLPSSDADGWQKMSAADGAPLFTFRDDDRRRTLTVSSAYTHTPSSGKDNPDTWAYRTFVLVEQDPPLIVED